MELLITALIFIISLFFLVRSSDFFVDSAEKIGLFFKLPYFIVGVLIVGIGTSLPELATSLISVIENQVSIPVSNVIGSNIANILFIGGLSAIITPLIIKKKLIKVEIPFLLLSSLLPALFLFNNRVSFIEGLVLILSFFIYLVYILKQEKNNIINIKINLIKEFLILFSSLVVLTISSKYVISSLVDLSKILSIKLDILSAVLLALGTSLPELVVSLSILKNSKSHDLIIGNIIGSNIINVFLILGLSSIIKPLIADKILFYLSIFLFLITLLFVFIILDNKIEREEGLILLIMYLVFTLYLFNPKLF